MTPIAIDALVSLGGLILPPAYDFIKKKFIKGSDDTPERTISSLAMTNPEVLPEYIKGLAIFKEAEIKWFNRDVIGEVSRWVSDLRACIRPVTVIGCMVLLAADGFSSFTLDQGTRAFCCANISSWMGSRLVKN